MIQQSRIILVLVMQEIKTESTRKLSNFMFQWTQNLVPEQFKEYCIFFLHFSRARDVIISHP